MRWKAKHVQVVDALRELLAAGEWSGVLPGYRTLAERLEVSRPTLEKALAELTAEGWLAAPGIGRARRILAPALSGRPVSQAKALLLLASESFDELNWESQHALMTLANGAREDGWRVAQDHFPFERFQRPERLLGRTLRNHHPDRVALLLPTRPVVRWFMRQELPFFCFGGEIRWAIGEIEGVSTLLDGMIEQAAGLLRSHGHHRILAPVSHAHGHLRDHFVDHAKQTWAHDLDRTELRKLMPVQAPLQRDAVAANWRKWLEALEPTAVILRDPREQLSLAGFCHKAGIRIPADLSIITLSGEPLQRWMEPVPTVVRVPTRESAKWALQWLRLPAAKPRGCRMLEGELVEGGTVAAPRKTLRMRG